MASQAQIESFYRFATEQLSDGGSEMTVDELYGQWRLEYGAPDDIAENIAAIQSSIDDMANGKTGRDASEVIRKLRAEQRIAIDE